MQPKGQLSLFFLVALQLCASTWDLWDMHGGQLTAALSSAAM